MENKILPQISLLADKILVGMSIELSIVKNRTGDLFREFMPRRSEIQKTKNANIFSLQEYPADYFTQFDPTKVFTKWALIEVEGVETLPAGMEIFELKQGLYAVFQYRGLSSDKRIFNYIFTEWLPNSDYELADRPHFEILGEKFKIDKPDSEEEIWIPIQLKRT